MKLQLKEQIETPTELTHLMVHLAEELIKYLAGHKGPHAVKRLGIIVNPDLMAMNLLEKFVYALPPEYRQVTRYEGHKRLFASGEYELLKPIPQAVVLETLRKSGILA